MITLLLLTLAIHCAAGKEQKPVQPVVPIKIHKQGPNFGDFEVPKNQLWMGCHQFVESKMAMVNFYIVGEKESHEFLYPRTMEPKECEKELQLLRKVIRNSKNIRIVGRSPFGKPEPQEQFRGEPPARFISKKLVTTWYYSRIQAEGRCLAWTSQHCDLPEEYWAGTTPF